MAEQSNVLMFPVARIKCPVGSRVLHPDHGWCDVIACSGSVRTIQAVSYTEFGCSTSNVDVDAGELIDGNDSAALSEMADMLRALGACKS